MEEPNRTNWGLLGPTISSWMKLEQIRSRRLRVKLVERVGSCWVKGFSGS